MSPNCCKLRRFRIEGYKALLDIDVSIPGNLLFLIGANGAGKSSILQALAFIQYFARGRSVQFFEDRGWERKELRSRIRMASRPGIKSQVFGRLIFEILLDVSGIDVYWTFDWSLSSGRLNSEAIWIRGSTGEAQRVVRYTRFRGFRAFNQDFMPLTGVISEGSIMAVVETKSLSPDHADLLAAVHAW